MTAVTPGFETKGVFELQGGIERYLKTHPEGGHWKGKNYVFDRRLVQVPEGKAGGEAEAEVESTCASCDKVWGTYRGKYKCCGAGCAVPVIVCDPCAGSSTFAPKQLMCPLCKEGYVAPLDAPDLVEHKRLLKSKARRDMAAVAAAAAAAAGEADETDEEEGGKKAKKKKEDKSGKKRKGNGYDGNVDDDDDDESAVDGSGGSSSEAGKSKRSKAGPPRRVFIGKLPFILTATQLGEALGSALGGASVETVEWKTDRNTGLFYGSAFVQMSTAEAAAGLADLAAPGGQGKGEAGPGVHLNGKKIRINLAPLRDGEVWPPSGHTHVERAPAVV